MDSFFTFQPPVIGHRGARALAPENTMASFRLARDSGAEWIETDVKLTQDGTPILMHDEDLARTTNGAGAVAATDWTEMQKLDAGSWFSSAFANERVPLLSDFLGFAIKAHIRVNLELKPCPGRARATAMVTLMEAAKIWPDDQPPPLISSFDIEALLAAAQLHPEWPRGLLLDEWRNDWRDIMARTQASSIHINDDGLDAGRVAELRQTGTPVLAFTVNAPARAKQLLQWGVNAVFSDDPGSMIKAL